jgi:chemotaxis protein CheX
MLGDAGKAQINEHLWDAVGEMCNMVAGNFKNKLPNLADNCLLSVPTVIVGKDYKLRPRTGGKTIEVLLQFDGYPVAVTLNVHT